MGLWVAAAILGPSRLSLGSRWTTVVAAGLLLALVNMVIKPVLIIMSFPAIILSLGLFMLILNGLMIVIVSWLYSSLYVKSFGIAILAGLIVGLVNFLVTKVMEDI